MSPGPSVGESGVHMREEKKKYCQWLADTLTVSEAAQEGEEHLGG